MVKILFIREILVLVHGQLEGASYRTESGQTPILWQSSSSRERGRRRCLRLSAHSLSFVR